MQATSQMQRNRLGYAEQVENTAERAQPVDLARAFPTAERPQPQRDPALSNRALPPGTSVWLGLRTGFHSGASVILLALQRARTELVEREPYMSLTALLVISVLLCLVALGIILLLSAQDSQAFGGDKGLLRHPPDQPHMYAHGRSESPPPRHQARGVHQQHEDFSDVGRCDSHASSTHSLVSAGRPPEPPLPGWPGTTDPHAKPYGAFGASTVGGGQLKHFCPELVVPRGHEAVLAVPLQDSASFEVRDVEGKPVIRAESAPHEQHRPVVVLHAAGPQGKRLAFCRLASHGLGAPAPAGRPAVDIYNAREERFGTISKVGSPNLLPAMWRTQDQPRPTAEPFRPCYVFSGSGTNLLLSGNFVDHAVSITGEQRELIADTEPSPMAFDHQGMYYRLRVASSGDVGLILSALLAIKVMEMR